MPFLDLWFSAVPLDPVEQVPIHPRDGGISTILQVYFDPSDPRKQQYLKCDLCSKFIKIGSGRSTKKMVAHRGAKDCEEYKVRFARERLLWSEQRKAEKAAEGIWPTGSGVKASIYVKLNCILTNSNMYYLVVFDPIDENDEPTVEELSMMTDTFTLPDPAMPLDTNDLDAPQGSSTLQLCPGVRIHWTPGSVWDTYAYQQHHHSSIGWNLVSSDGEFVVLRSKRCNGSLATDDERLQHSCSACHGLIGSEPLNRFIERATGDAPLQTPYMYLNMYQSQKLLAYMNKKIKRLQKKVEGQIGRFPNTSTYNVNVDSKLFY
jgi:hypothetical protein